MIVRILFVFLFVFNLFAADVRWTFVDFTATPQAVKKIYITPIASYGTSTTNIITGDRRTFTNDSSGSLIVSNVIVGRTYRVEFVGSFTSTIITNSFDTNVTGFVEASDPLYLDVPIRDGSTVAYSKAASDARFAPIGSGASITPFYVSSTNTFGFVNTNAITIETNGVNYVPKFSGDGSGLANVPASSIVKYISQTKPLNADSNWFGPWTPGTTTAGIQEAWDSVVKPTNAGPTARGVVFQFEGGYYYFTNTLVFSNYWPMAMTFRGANLLDTKLVYAGSEVGTNTVTFKGAGTPRDGSLNLPVHLTVTDMGFSSIKDTTNVLVKVGNFSHANFTRCNFTSWSVMTNQVEGAGVSTDTASVGGGTHGSLVGLYITDGPEHSTILMDIFFAGLATGLDLRNDHVTAHSLKFAHIGIFTNLWPASSRYSLGACIVQEQNLDSAYYYCHFYSARRAYVYVSNGGTPYGAPLLDHANFESISGNELVASDGLPILVRDPVEYGDNGGWNGLYVSTLSNSPNWGVLSTFSQVAVAYGTDGMGAYNNSEFWRIRLGQTNLISASAAQITLNTRLILNTPTSFGEFNPDSAVTIGDLGGNNFCTFGVDGNSESSVSHTTPKLIIGTPTITSGAGAPSSDEPKGSVYLRTDGSTSTSIYIKTATGGGGWTAK